MIARRGVTAPTEAMRVTKNSFWEPRVAAMMGCEGYIDGMSGPPWRSDHRAGRLTRLLGLKGGGRSERIVYLKIR